MKQFIKLTLATLMLISCSAFEQDINYYKKNVIRVDSGTKTAIIKDGDGHSLTWTKFDSFGLFIDGIHDNLLYENSNTSSLEEFECYYGCKKVVKECKIAAYYPYQSQDCPDQIVYATLPVSQTFPFDKKANFMVAHPDSKINYDCAIPDGISLDFAQLFGIIELRITNTKDSYAEETIQSITLTDNDSGVTLTGDFCLNPFTGDLSFNGANTFNFVTSLCDDLVISKGVTKSAYLFVNPIDIKSYTVTVATENRTLSFSHSSEETPLSICAGKVTMLPLIDLSDVKQQNVKKRKKIVCWGDSFTCNSTPTITYTSYLQDLLGSDWKVYCGAIPGQQPLDIAPEQGGVQIYLNVTSDQGLTIPADTKVYNAPLCVGIDEYMTKGDFPLWRSWGTSTPLLNPCTINGVQFNITKNTIQRVSAGAEPLYISKGKTNVYTWAQNNVSDADVTVMYIGANYGWGNSLKNLAGIQELMVDYIYGKTGKRNYIVLGFHNTPQSLDYQNIMESYFGDHFMNLIPVVLKDDKWKQLLLQTHVRLSESDPISDADQKYVDKGYWPVSFYKGDTDHHPSFYGAHAMAILIYEKMEELGYLDD